MDYLKSPSHLQTHNGKHFRFCRSLQRGDFSCWNSNTIRNTYSLENNSSLEIKYLKKNKKINIKWQWEQSQAGSELRNSVTALSHWVNKARRCQAIKNLFAFRWIFPSWSWGIQGSPCSCGVGIDPGSDPSGETQTPLENPRMEFGVLGEIPAWLDPIINPIIPGSASQHSQNAASQRNSRKAEIKLRARSSSSVPIP